MSSSFLSTRRINNNMAVQIIKVDSSETRFAQSFVNLTELNSTTYPAVTTMQIDNTMQIPLTTYSIYDQWAFRTIGYNEP